jgi:asparagine synthase (glutamine-hydrolysing)
MVNTQTVEQLEKEVYNVINDINIKNLGISFSGGVDSTLLAKVCSDLGKNVKMLTVGFSSERDLKISSEVAKLTDLKNLFQDLISLEEMEKGLKIVLRIIEFKRLVRLENAVCFYYVFRLASKHKINTVLSANGIDELFCGYSVFLREYGNEKFMTKLMKEQVNTARRDKEEIDKLASLFGINYFCPFLTKRFVDFSMKIPLTYKIKNKDDNIRKNIFRKVALNIGLPEKTALRTKKAFQYSSGFHKALIKLSRINASNRKNVKIACFSSKLEAYLSVLKRQNGI